jgi:UDP-GlcNAc:undecaprenyl-phosphate GlcNAc-1-phosphate transferase
VREPLVFLVLVCAAALITLAATPVWALLARRVGLVVQPRDDRWHKTPTPILGGAAIALSVLIVLALVVPLNRDALVMLVGIALAFALGLLDDFRHLAPTNKLVGQVVIAVVLVFGGLQVTIVQFPPIAFVLTVFWVVGMMNAVNLLDNMDGLAAGVTAIAAIALGLTALPENALVAQLAAVTAGAAIGFLVFNFHPAKVFMGDSGSLVLGLLLAGTALLHTASGAANLGIAVLAPLVVLALPIFDTVLVATSRRMAGIPVSRGGRDHTSHRLAALGLSDRSAVLFLYAIALALSLLGAVLTSPSLVAIPIVALAVVALVLFGTFLAEVDVYGRGQSDYVATPVRSAFLTYVRFGAEVGLDVVLLTSAYYLAYVIRFEGIDQVQWIGLFVQSLPIVVATQLAAFVLSRLYRTLWRHFGVSDVVAVIRAVLAGTAVGTLAVVGLFRFEDYSRMVFVLDAVLAVVFVLATRSFALWLRQVFGGRASTPSRRVLIVGATDAGALALRLLTRAGDVPYRVVGFLDDDPSKRYRRIGGVPIVGRLDEIEAAIARERPDVVVVADAPATVRSRIREICLFREVECREFLVQV